MSQEEKQAVSAYGEATWEMKEGIRYFGILILAHLEGMKQENAASFIEE